MLNLLLLSGSEAPWHGIHILLNSIERYQGPCSIHCYIAGNISLSESQRIQSLFCNGTSQSNGKGSRSARRSMSCRHRSIGAWRKIHDSGCPLKVREYWSRGLPFIIGYEDVDLNNFPEMQPYYLRVDVNGNEWFDLDRVVNFAADVYRDQHVAERMRDYARTKIDSRLKMERYAEFVKSVIAYEKARRCTDSRFSRLLLLRRSTISKCRF